MRFFKQLFCNHEYKYLGSYQRYTGDWYDVVSLRIDKYKCNKCNRIREDINIEL